MNNESKAFLVSSAHRSEYPNPITFRKGTPLVVGERYEGERSGTTGSSAIATDSKGAGCRPRSSGRRAMARLVPWRITRPGN